MATVSQPVKISSTSLPSFSTPGFGKLGAREVISISSDSNPSSPQNIKRTSSDSSFTFDPSPQSSKRLKRDCLANKENLFQPILLPDSKGKDKQLPSASHTKPVEHNDDQGWRKIKFDADHNPWAKLNRDFPSYSLPGPCLEDLNIPELDSDLLSVRSCSFDIVLAVYTSLTERRREFENASFREPRSL